MSNGSAGLRQAPNAVINRGSPSGWLRFSDGSRRAASRERLALLTRLSLENLTPLSLRFVLGSGADYE